MLQSAEIVWPILSAIRYSVTFRQRETFKKGRDSLSISLMFNAPGVHLSKKRSEVGWKRTFTRDRRSNENLPIV
jgi:hypothetical protein